MNLPTTSIEFLKRIQPLGPWSLCYGTLKGVEPRVWVGRTFMPDEDSDCAAWIANNNAQYQVWYRGASIKPGQAAFGNREDVRGARFWWVDIDQRSGEDRDTERARILALLTSNRPAGVPHPSWIVDSGNGYQAGWMAESPMKLSADDGTMKEFESINYWLELQFEADKIHSSQHLLRLPFTINHKGTGNPASVVHFDDTLHLPSAFGREVPTHWKAQTEQQSAFIDKAHAKLSSIDQLPSCLGVEEKLWFNRLAFARKMADTHTGDSVWASRRDFIRDYICRANWALIFVHVKKSCPEPNVSRRDDFESAAAMALMLAVDKFDPSKGARFATYAWMLIRQVNIRQFSQAKTREKHFRPSDKIATLNPARHESSVDGQFSLETRELFDVADLTDQERHVIESRFSNTDHKMTLQGLASELGLSKERIRQIQKLALVKLQNAAIPATAGVRLCGGQNHQGNRVLPLAEFSGHSPNCKTCNAAAAARKEKCKLRKRNAANPA